MLLSVSLLYVVSLCKCAFVCSYIPGYFKSTNIVSRHSRQPAAPLTTTQRLSQLFNVNHFIVSQVNPHVIPFLQDDRRKVHNVCSCSSAYCSLCLTRVQCGLFSWLYQTAKYCVVSEVHHRLMQLMALGLIPTIHVLLQGYRGDITIVPQLNWWEYTKLISNPTEDFRQHCIREGERSTWPSM